MDRKIWVIKRVGKLYCHDTHIYNVWVISHICVIAVIFIQDTRSHEVWKIFVQGDFFFIGGSLFHAGYCKQKHGMNTYGSVSKPYTPGEHQNSWDLWMFIPLKMVLIGIDPYPYLDKLM